MPFSSVLGASTVIKPGVCTSTNRPANPYDGQVIYETDTDRTLVYNGTGWVFLSTSTANPVGLEFIKSVSFSASNQVDVTDCFSSTYDNYRVQIEWLQNTSNGNLQIQMRNSGGLITTNYGFDSGGNFYSSGTASFAAFNNSANETQTSMYVVGVVATFRGQASHDVFGPNLLSTTNWMGQAFTTNASATLTRVNLISQMRHNASTVCTGFSIIPSAGTVTGTVRVYGYDK
jgi:hypothetical protein